MASYYPPTERAEAIGRTLVSFLEAELGILLAVVDNYEVLLNIHPGDPILAQFWEFNQLENLMQTYKDRAYAVQQSIDENNCQCPSGCQKTSCSATNYKKIYEDAIKAYANFTAGIEKHYGLLVQKLNAYFKNWIEQQYINPADTVFRAETDRIREVQDAEISKIESALKVGGFTEAEKDYLLYITRQARIKLQVMDVRRNLKLDALREQCWDKYGFPVWAAETDFAQHFIPHPSVDNLTKPAGCGCNKDFNPDAEVTGGQSVIVSPIVLDLDGDGVETTDVNSGKVMFDFDGDGVKNRTGWISPDDGFLVFDRNGDGIINNGREMFGNHTLRYDGLGTCRDGYEALAQEDTNGDGVVNHLDDNWQHFKVWRDLNQNGITDEGELFTLEELGISSFEVGHSGGNTEQNGNTLQGEAVYYDINGDAHSFSDAWFIQNTFYTQYPDMEIPEHLKDLPGMNGSGNVRPILQACAGDEALASIYRQMSEAGSRQGQMALVEDLLYAWASSSGMTATYESRARACGAEGVYHNNLPMSVAEWDRILHVVQSFNGRYLVDLPNFTGITGYKCVSINWTKDMINKILNAYNALRDFAYSAVAVQTHLSEYMGLVITDVDPDTHEASYDFTIVEYFLSRGLESGDPIQVLRDLLDFQQVTSNILKRSEWSIDKLVSKIIYSMDMTPELQAVCEEYKLNVAGTAYFNPNGTAGRDVIYGGAANETLYGGAGNDIIYGGDGNDKLYGDAGNDILYGGEGDDTLYGGEGDDVLDGGAGNDYLQGDNGNNTYVFGIGYGHDTANAGSNYGYRQLVRLTGLAPDDVIFNTVFKGETSGNGYTRWNCYDLVIIIKSTGETLTIKKAIWDSTTYNRNSVQAFEFGDGTVMEWEEFLTSGLLKTIGTDGDDTLQASCLDTIMEGGAGNDILRGGAGNDILYGGEGDDTLYGGSGNDVLDGGAGNDYLVGGIGNATYVFGIGYGHDKVDANSNYADRHVVRLAGLTADDVTFNVVRTGETGYADPGYYNYYDLVITIKTTGETLTIKKAVWDTPKHNRNCINAIEFGDGSVMEWAEFLTSGLFKMIGTDGDDILQASCFDTIMEGGDGNDTLYGGQGNDILDGGAGNDYLVGGAGHNTYVFGIGHGHDTVSANSNYADRQVVRLVGLTVDDVTLNVLHTGETGYANPGYYNYYDLVITIKSTGETMTVKKAVWDSISHNRNCINAIEFGDGSVREWESLVASGLLKAIGTDGDDTLRASRLGTIMEGGEGDDILYGGRGNDVLDGGAGNDTLLGGGGNDTFVFGRGYGHDTVNANGYYGDRNTIRLAGLSRDEVYFKLVASGTGHDGSKQANYYSLVITIKSTGETLTIKNAVWDTTLRYNYYSVHAFEFGDGSVMEWSDLINSGMITAIGTDGDDTLRAISSISTTLYGGEGNDKLYGGAGNDTLDGGAGNDYLEGGAGSNTYVFGKGYGYDTVNAFIRNASRFNTILLKDLNSDEVEFRYADASSRLGRAAYDLVIYIKETGETLTVDLGLSDHWVDACHIQQVQFADGTIWSFSEILKNGLHGAGFNMPNYSEGVRDYDFTIYGNGAITGGNGNDMLYGGASNDTIAGGAGNDVLIGGAGNDILCGGAGDDTYIFRSGDGQDTINNTGGGNDLLSFVDIDPAQLWFGQSGNHLVIGLIGGSDKVTVNNWYASGDYKIDQIEAGGSYPVESQVAQLVQAMAAIGTPGGADGQWTNEQREALTPVLSTYWQPRV